MANYGLSSSGFTPLQLTEVKAKLESDMTAAFGAQLDLSSTSVLGNLSSIMANAYADLWAAAAAIYSNSFPAGASGVAVDNILAINGLSRLQPKATQTNPAVVSNPDGTVTYGLTLAGVPGTLVPAGTQFSNGQAQPITFALDQDVTIAAASNAEQAIYLTAPPDSGSYSLTFSAPGGQSLTTDPILAAAQPRQTRLSWASAPQSGAFQLSLGSAKTSSLAYNAQAAAVQAAIAAIAGYENTSVSGSVAAGFAISWAQGFVPRVTSSGAAAPAVLDAIQALINDLTATDGTKPLSDVLATGTTQAYTLSYGAFSPQSSFAGSGAQAFGEPTVASDTLFAGQSQVSVTPQILVVGSPAQGIGHATAIQTGPQAVSAHGVSTIVTPVTGLTAVDNPLDCITGRDTETDAEAISRLRSSQGTAASGSLGAILNKVAAVAGVTQAVGAQNTSNAAQQLILFGDQPTQGQFNIALGGQVTALLAYTATPLAVQQAIQALVGFGRVLVSASGPLGYAVDFSSSQGAQGLGLATFPTNTTGMPLTAYFGRTAHSIEITALGGQDEDIAQAILSALPAGINTYGAPAARTTATLARGSANITVASSQNIEPGQAIEGAGIPLGTQVASAVNATVAMTNSATTDANMEPVTFGHAARLKDVAGNPLSVAFSRPTTVPIYVSLAVITDRYLVAGDSSSGTNAASVFNLASVQAIQQGLMDVINATPIGGSILVNGTRGLLNSFRSVPGVVDASIALGRSPSPTQADNISLAANEAPIGEYANVVVSVQ